VGARRARFGGTSPAASAFSWREVTLSLGVTDDDGATMKLVLPQDWRDVFTDPSKPPFWALPWPSGTALAYHFLKKPELVAGRRVLDLGCGVGPAGLAAAMAGAAHVELTDYDPHALHCAAKGAEANFPSGSEQGQRCSTRGLDWHDERSIISQVSASGQFDVVCACDVFYEPENLSAISRMLPRLLAPGGALMAAVPIDSEYRPNATRERADKGLATLGCAGFTVQSLSECDGVQLPGQGPDGLAASRKVLIAKLVMDQ
jgi:predicted nicotinamide N-methyase